jgi:hypothetical protein
MMSEDLLSTSDICRSDPLAGLLLRRWHMPPWRFGLTLLLVGLGYMGGLAAVFGYFVPRPGIIASQIDYFNQLGLLFVIPAIGFYYLAQPSQITHAHVTLVKCIDEQNNAIKSLSDAIIKMYAHWGWWLAGLLFGLLGIAIGVYDNWLKLGTWWYAANWVMIGTLQGLRGISYYMLVLIYARHIVATIGLNQIHAQCRIPLVVLPASPDSGIRAVGHYAFAFIAFNAVVGLIVGTAPILSTGLGKDYPYQVILYLILAPAAFFLPLCQAHRSMVRTKNRIIDDLAARYQTTYDQLLRHVDSDGEAARKNLDRLETLEKAYDLARASWTWPFDTSLLLRVGITIVVPFGPWALQAGQQFVASWLAQLIAQQ